MRYFLLLSTVLVAGCFSLPYSETSPNRPEAKVREPDFNKGTSTAVKQSSPKEPEHVRSLELAPETTEKQDTAKEPEPIPQDGLLIYPPATRKGAVFRNQKLATNISEHLLESAYKYDGGVGRLLESEWALIKYEKDTKRLQRMAIGVLNDWKKCMRMKDRKGAFEKMTHYFLISIRLGYFGVNIPHVEQVGF